MIEIATSYTECYVAVPDLMGVFRPLGHAMSIYRNGWPTATRDRVLKLAEETYADFLPKPKEKLRRVAK